MAVTTKLGALIEKASQHKAEQLGIKRYSLRRLATDAGTAQPYLTRCLHGKATPSREILTKLCNALECTPEERADIFHAVGYLAPEELDEASEAA